jgi:hypothetical protein
MVMTAQRGLVTVRAIARKKTPRPVMGRRTQLDFI